MARIDGRDAAAISSQPPGAAPQAVWNTYIRVESADDAAARVRQAGGRVLSEPFDVFDAGRMGVFADPEGAVPGPSATPAAEVRLNARQPGCLRDRR
jgi:predicted enzyme related to lactoylglutathione lyase